MFRRSHTLQEAVTSAFLGLVMFFIGWWSIGTISPVVGGFWWLGFILALVSVSASCLFLALTRRLRLRRAWVFHLIVGCMYLFSALPALAAAGLILGSLVSQPLSIGLLTTIAIGGLIARIVYVRSHLNHATHHNIHAGRLNLEYGRWDLSISLLLDSPKSTATSRARWRQLQLLVPLFGALFLFCANSLGEKSTPVTMGQCLVLSGLMILWLPGGNNWGTALQLREWEKMRRIPIETTVEP